MASGRPSARTCISRMPDDGMARISSAIACMAAPLRRRRILPNDTERRSRAAWYRAHTSGSRREIRRGVLMAANLADRRCVPCHGGVPSLTAEEIAPLLAQLDGWAIVEEH